MESTIFQTRVYSEVKFTCEDCIKALEEKNADLLQISSFSQCADFSAVLMQPELQGSVFFEKIALLCIGLCQECIEICDQFPGNAIFIKCADACRQCSQALCLQISDNDISQLAPGEV